MFSQFVDLDPPTPVSPNRTFWLVCPAFADVFVGCEAAQGLQTTTVIVCVDEVMEVRGQLSMTVVMVALDRGFLDRPVHSFDLAALSEQNCRSRVRAVNRVDEQIRESVSVL